MNLYLGMLFYTAITIITIYFARFIRNQRMQKPAATVVAQQFFCLTKQQTVNGLCLLIIFFILFMVSAFRTGIGNDYERYVEFVHLIEFEQVVPTEIGFNLLVKLINGLSGFENPKLMFGIYAFVTILLFLLAMMRQSVDFPMTFFLFMTLGYYFQTMNTVRYYLALAIALVCMKYVLNRQYIYFMLLVLLGSTFHKSLLVILPLYLLATVNWKKWHLVSAGFISISFLLFQDFYLKVVVLLYPSYANTEYLAGGTSIPNILRCLAVLVLSLLYYKKCVEGNRELRFYFYLNLGAVVLYTCCSFLPIISRIGYYLTISHIFFLPAIIRSFGEKERKQKLFWKGAVLAAGAVYFLLFLFKASNINVGLLPYDTWLW